MWSVATDYKMNVSRYDLPTKVNQGDVVRLERSVDHGKTTGRSFWSRIFPE